MNSSGQWRYSVVRWIGFAVTTLFVLPGVCLGQHISWERLSEGLMVSVWKPIHSCPTVPTMLVVDLDPERTRFSVHNYAQEGFTQPPKIGEWQHRTGHPLVFNAGLFRENFTYLGLLYQSGRSVGSRRHSSWKGLFVAEPTAIGVKKARVLDLASDTFDEQRPVYGEVAQALMLLDQSGKIRVRDSGKYAYQTIVAETERGHILVFKSLGVVPLYDIGRCFKETLPTIRRAMAMDGGSSSDLRIVESLWEKDLHSQEGDSWKSLFSGSTSFHIPLPTVIGVSPR
ncbi:MAG: phosphodiester glycosidase family protein [Nitrospira sp.]|nr:phosphodiester glycosidase family protein [Nitrospira sp.]